MILYYFVEFAGSFANIALLLLFIGRLFPKKEPVSKWFYVYVVLMIAGQCALSLFPDWVTQRTIYLLVGGFFLALLFYEVRPWQAVFASGAFFTLIALVEVLAMLLIGLRIPDTDILMQAGAARLVYVVFSNLIQVPLVVLISHFFSRKGKLKCTVRDFEEVKRAVDYLKAHSLNTVEDLNQAIDSLNQTAAPLRKQLKQNENRMRAIAQIKDAAAVHAKLKPIHDIFIKKNFKLTKDAYAAQHKEELDIFNKAVRTLMKLNGSIAVDFSALDAEFSALQSSSAEFRTQLETLQPDISDLKSVRKYIDMVLNKQQLFAPGGKTPEKESVLKKLEQFQQKKSHHKTTSTPPNREESL